jgi:uncharacterized protein (DUF2147 family)
MRRPLLALLALAAAAPAAANPAHGLWRTEARDDGAYLVVELLPCEGAPAETCGVIREAVTAEGPEPRYPHLGRVMIDGMEAEGTEFSGGTIWAPDDDETYRAGMSLKGDVLEVEGCVLVFCRGQDWRRAD